MVMLDKSEDLAAASDSTGADKAGLKITSTKKKAVAKSTSSGSRAKGAGKKPGRGKTRRKRQVDSKVKSAQKTGAGARTRQARPYPAAPFEESLVLADAIQKFAAGEKVRRLTLLKQMDRSPTSSSTQMLITNSSKYGLTTGSYAADWIELTKDGKAASSPDADRISKLPAQFKLAIENTDPFRVLYEEYKNKKLPSHDVLKDVLREQGVPEEHISECVDTFIVNSKFLGLLQTIAGSEVLVSIEQLLDEGAGSGKSSAVVTSSAAAMRSAVLDSGSKTKWENVCFYISPIGDEDSEIRKHSDLFLSSIVEPSLEEFGLIVVRADMIGEAGMITSQVLEHVMRAKLAIVDLSWHNPNAFYEMAIRHACKLPIIQVCRRADRLPFDVNQVRTVVIDTTDIYTFTPRLETYRSEIASQVRAVLKDPIANSNPLTVFFPGFEVNIPREK
jgi:hypothetical protein